MPRSTRHSRSLRVDDTAANECTCNKQMYYIYFYEMLYLREDSRDVLMQTTCNSWCAGNSVNIWYLQLDDYRVSCRGSNDNVGTSSARGAVGTNTDSKLAVHCARRKRSLQLRDKPVAGGGFCDALEAANVQLVVE